MGSPAADITITGLSVSVRRSMIPVVADINFKISSGRMMALVGESGSGKSTVGLAMLGYARRGLAITSGQVLIGNKDMLTLPPAEMRRARGALVSYVPQDPASALNPTLRVGTQLREVFEAHRDQINGPASARLEEVLAEVGLDGVDVMSRFPHQLSGGQQQRVAIGMAFACRPRLVVLDEPTTGLDVTTQRTVIDTLRAMCSAYSVAGLYVSHDLAVVSGLANSVAVMYAGSLVETGETAAVFGHPAHPYTCALLAAVPSPDETTVLVGLEGRQPRPGAALSGCQFAPRCSQATEGCLQRLPAMRPAVGDGHIVRCIMPADPPSRLATTRIRTGAPTPTPGTRDALVATALTAGYRGSVVLRDVDVDVSMGECVAVVGESGSGKTTLARCLAGLHTDWSGEVRMGGQAIPTSTRARSSEELRRIQYIFQNPYSSLNPRKRVAEIMAQPIDRFRVKIAAKEALGNVGLGSDVLWKYPGELSGGQRQRVAIARALVVRPDFLICDEITSALDVSVQATIVKLLREQQTERGMGLLFITHNLALVHSIAQRIFVIAAGRIAETGLTDEVLTSPRHPYTKGLLADVPRLVTHGR